MEKILLLSRDDSLEGELASAVAPGFTVVRGTGLKTDGAEDHIIFFDMDTMNISLTKEAAEKTFVIAVTREERTGIVMEAATFGAYEILRRPLGKEGVSALLREIHELRKELSR